MENTYVKKVVKGIADVLLKISFIQSFDVPEYRGGYTKGDTEALRETMRGQFLQLKQKGLSIRIITMWAEKDKGNPDVHRGR